MSACALTGQIMEADQFYSGLIAELYEPLAGQSPELYSIRQFIDRYGGPTLELGCGTGLPMLPLMTEGYDIEGVDASADMLTICASKGRQQGLSPVLHQALFQDFDLQKQFQSIYIASSSFTLLTDDHAAGATLEGVYRHLNVGGALWMTLDIPQLDRVRASINQFKEGIDSQGRVIRVGVTEVEAEQQNMRITLRYERQTNGETEVLTRVWHRRWWLPDQIEALLLDRGFGSVKVLSERADAKQFAVIAEKS